MVPSVVDATLSSDVDMRLVSSLTDFILANKVQFNTMNSMTKVSVTLTECQGHKNMSRSNFPAK